MLRCVLFDCDGVLINSEDLVEEAQQEVYAEFGVNLSIDDIRARLTGLTFEDYIQTRDAVYREQTGRPLPDQYQERLDAVFNRKALQQLCAIDGIPELLRALTDAGIPFCVASNSGIARLHGKLHATGLHSHFHPHIYSREHVKNGKPAPDLFLHAAKQLGDIDPADCIVVEDSRPGAQAGVAAGMHVIGFARHGGAQIGQLVDVGVRDIVTSGKSLKQRIFQLLSCPVPPMRPAPQP